MERHHNAKTQELLTKTQLLNHLPLESQLIIRKGVTATILATDMSHHAEAVSTMDDVATAVMAATETQERAVTTMALVGTLVHAADLSGQCMPRHLSERWGQGCRTEFSNQVSEL